MLRSGRKADANGICLVPESAVGTEARGACYLEQPTAAAWGSYRPTVSGPVVYSAFLGQRRAI